MATKRKPIPLYFTKRDDDIWEELQKVPEGDRSHVIRMALRMYFSHFGDATPKVKPDNDNDLKDVNVGMDLIK